jgi:N-acetylglucosaminyldiphosphoundecaprenol N-acetyl-beta-D-mannosaminyltransferase
VEPSEHTCVRRVDGPRVNGVRIDPLDPDAFLEAVWSFLSCGRSHTVHFCAAHPTTEARRDPAYRALLNRGDLNVADGAPVAWAARAQGYPAVRLAGSDGLGLVADRGLRDGLGHFLYGGTPATLQRLRANLEREHPGIRIVGAEAPPFRPVTDEELSATLDRMRETGAQAVWIGLGAPKQDVMGARMRELGAAPLLFCVGAAFDFLSGTKRRAPMWMRRLGLEWLHRLLSEPGRLWKRYLIGNTRFLAGVLTDRVRDVRGRRRAA